MKATTNSGTYKVNKIGNSFFPVFQFNDGEVLFLGKSYGTEKGAEKRLKNHCDSANIKLSIN